MYIPRKIIMFSRPVASGMRPIEAVGNADTGRSRNPPAGRCIDPGEHLEQGVLSSAV